MIELKHNQSVNLFRGARPQDFSFSASFSDLPRSIAPSACAETAVDDAIFDRCTSESFVTDKLLQLETNAALWFTLKSPSQSIFTVNQDGFCGYQSPGSSRVEVITPIGRYLTASTVFQQAGGGVSDDFLRNVSGTLSEVSWQTLQSLLSDLSQSNQVNMFSGSIKNPGRWAPEIDLSGVSMGIFPLARVSSRGYLCSTHVRPPTGATFSFLNTENIVEVAEVETVTNIGDDISVVKTTNSLSAGVCIFKILPDASGYIVNGRPGMLARLWNQGPRLWGTRVSFFGVSHPYSQAQPGTVPTGNLVNDSYPSPYSGDSGSPFFLPISESEIALVSHAVGIGAICYGPKSAQIDAVLATFGESSTWQDISIYPSYE